MTGGRAYLYDPDGRHVAALDARSVNAVRLAVARGPRGRAAASTSSGASSRTTARPAPPGRPPPRRTPRLESDVWLVEPIAAPAPPVAASTVGRRRPIPRRDPLASAVRPPSDRPRRGASCARGVEPGSRRRGRSQPRRLVPEARRSIVQGGAVRERDGVLAFRTGVPIALFNGCIVHRPSSVDDVPTPSTGSAPTSPTNGGFARRCSTGSPAWWASSGSTARTG